MLTGLLLLGGFGSSVTAQPVQFGVNTKFDQGLTGMAMIEHILATGVTVSRDSLSWQNVEVDRGQYVWSPAYGRRYATLAQHGIRSNVILTVGNKIYDGGKFPTSPAAVAAYARFAGFVARTLRGQTVAYEIGNEWRSTPVAGGRTTFIDYARLFVAAADAIHAADPSARVVADPAIFANASATAVPAVGTPLGDTARLALRVADGVVVHQYPYQASGRSFADAQAGMIKAMTRRADWLAAMAGRQVSLYVTEFGWPQIATRGLTPDEQAMQLATTTRALAALSFVRLAVVYELADSCSQAASIECTFGLYRRQNGRFVAKPALAAFRNAVAAK